MNLNRTSWPSEGPERDGQTRPCSRCSEASSSIFCHKFRPHICTQLIFDLPRRLLPDGVSHGPRHILPGALRVSGLELCERCHSRMVDGQKYAKQAKQKVCLDVDVPRIGFMTHRLVLQHARFANHDTIPSSCVAMGRTCFCCVLHVVLVYMGTNVALASVPFVPVSVR